MKDENIYEEGLAKSVSLDNGCKKGIYMARGSKWDFVPFGSFTMQFI